jgi:hypothetical protein
MSVVPILGQHAQRNHQGRDSAGVEAQETEKRDHEANTSEQRIWVGSEKEHDAETSEEYERNTYRREGEE